MYSLHTTNIEDYFWTNAKFKFGIASHIYIAIHMVYFWTNVKFKFEPMLVITFKFDSKLNQCQIHPNWINATLSLQNPSRT
jgi:Na+-transporting methylmalonyl-CoA/oxaloacetate decarboxylase beta subunit